MPPPPQGGPTGPPLPAASPGGAPAATRVHLCALARADGYYELRCLQRRADDSTGPGPSIWLAREAGRLRNLPAVLAWAAQQHARGLELFVGPNPRAASGGRQKAAVQTLTACYADLDLHGARLAEAQAALLAAPCPPSLIVASGYGLHPLWLLAPDADKEAWRQVQRGLAAAFAAYAPDPAVVGDEARILRLAPYPNRKHGRVVPTALLHQSARTYTLAELAALLFTADRSFTTEALAPLVGTRRHGETKRVTEDTTEKKNDLLEVPVTQESGRSAANHQNNNKTSVSPCLRGEQRLRGEERDGVPAGLQARAAAGQGAGTRNSFGFWLACRLVEQVADPAVGRAVLARYGAACRPPLAPDEVAQLWTNARGQTAFGRHRDAPPPDGDPPAAIENRKSKIENPQSADPRPLIDVAGEIHRVRDALLDALGAANQPAPSLFQRGRALVRVVQVQAGGEAGGRLEAHTVDSLRARVAECARLVRPGGPDGAGRPVAAATSLLGAVLQADRFPFPVLDGLSAVPVVRPDGGVHDTPGYDPATRLIYQPAPDLCVPPVPAAPDAAAVAAARTLLLDELLGDFPFTGPTERAHAVALFLLPFVRPLIDGPTPLHLIESPTPGSGKTLLTELLLWPACGGALVSDSDKEHDDEMSKWITAKVLRGAPVLWLDNLRAGLAGSTLASALTARVWSGRILGQSATVEAPLTAVWVATANNPTLSTEIARRTVRIRIDPLMDRPQLRTGFRHAAPRAWVRAQRGALVGAALTLVRAWVAAGQPAGGATLGSYEAWAAVLGGILGVAGIPGFLGNLLEVYDLADTEGTAWRALVAAWWARYGATAVSAADVYALAQTVDGFDLGSSANERTVLARFGKALGRQRDRIYGQLRIRHAGLVSRAARWVLEPTGGNASGPDAGAESEGVKESEADSSLREIDSNGIPIRDDADVEDVIVVGGESPSLSFTPSLSPAPRPPAIPRPLDYCSRCGDRAWAWDAAAPRWFCATCADE